ncbi:MAG: hypothetical protein U0894_10465 [Pirellulales bacterium]
MKRRSVADAITKELLYCGADQAQICTDTHKQAIIAGTDGKL